ARTLTRPFSQPLTTISINTSFHASIGPGIHQCKQSLITFFSPPLPANGWKNLYGPGCPSGLINASGPTSISPKFTPLSFALTRASPNSSISTSLKHVVKNLLVGEFEAELGEVPFRAVVVAADGEAVLVINRALWEPTPDREYHVVERGVILGPAVVKDVKVQLDFRCGDSVNVLENGGLCEEWGPQVPHREVVGREDPSVGL
ncbi:50S ribosomal protein L13, partial [Striga asiatica]